MLCSQVLEELQQDECCLKLPQYNTCHGVSILLNSLPNAMQAHLASVNSVDEVKTVMDALLKVNKIANATHNIMAYRIHLQEKQSFLQVKRYL
jgi:hypothetical protein